MSVEKMSGECDLCHEHTLECKCEKDIPMSDNMRIFFCRLVDLKLCIKEKLDERFTLTCDELLESYFYLREYLLKVYKELDELIKEKK